ncbi:MAG: hypothetical protein ACOYXS_00485 [Chloroflexota bacterium]
MPPLALGLVIVAAALHEPGFRNSNRGPGYQDCELSTMRNPG